MVRFVTPVFSRLVPHMTQTQTQAVQLAAKYANVNHQKANPLQNQTEHLPEPDLNI